MKNVRLFYFTGERGDKVLVNLERVSYFAEASSHFGDKYTEVFFGSNRDGLHIKESIAEVEKALKEKE